MRQRIAIGRVAWAWANWGADGWPQVHYYEGYFELPALMQLFSTAHECGHLVLQTSDEVAPSCWAARTLQLNRRQRRSIGDYYVRLGQIGTQYGGSGSTYWQRLLNACPDAVG